MADQDVDYYALLGVGAEASAAEIRKAYRQKSLKVHPDRNPDNPEAAALFHELTIGYEILSDPTKRDSFDKLYKARNARKERFSKLDNKRKTMQEDLIAREKAFAKQKQEENMEKAELERLRAEGEMLRKRKEKKYEEEFREIIKKEDQEKRAAQDAAHSNGRGGGGESEELGPLDTTVRLKWLRKSFPTLESDTNAFSELLPSMSANFVDSIVLSSKITANPKLKNGTAVVAFKTLTAALRVVEASGKGKLSGIEVSWAAGQEPEALKRSRASEVNGAGFAQEKRKPSTSPPPRVQTKMPKLDEDSVLDQLRARERERERLEEEIRRQDEEDEAAGR